MLIQPVTIGPPAFIWRLQWSTVWLESLTVVPSVITFSAVDHCEFIWNLQWSTVWLDSLTVVSFVTAPFKANHCTSISHPSRLLYTVIDVKVIPSTFNWSTIDHSAFLLSL